MVDSQEETMESILHTFDLRESKVRQAKRGQRMPSLIECRLVMMMQRLIQVFPQPSGSVLRGLV